MTTPSHHKRKKKTNDVPRQSHLDLARLRSNAFLFIAVVIILINTIKSVQDIRQTQQKRKQIPFFFPGYKFSGLESIFKDIPSIGYYTDKDLDDEQHAAQFAQAQYILAPTILDWNNLDHDLILLECSNAETAWKKIREIQAIPLKRNNFGIILARRTKP